MKIHYEEECKFFFEFVGSPRIDQEKVEALRLNGWSYR